VSPEALREERRIEPITVTVKQFCEISNLSKDSIYKLINSGEIRSVVICGRRLIDMASYRAFVARIGPHTSARRGGMSGGKVNNGKS
jgi:excisionase family DNA binding protein